MTVLAGCTTTRPKKVSQRGWLSSKQTEKSIKALKYCKVEAKSRNHQSYSMEPSFTSIPGCNWNSHNTEKAFAQTVLLLHLYCMERRVSGIKRLSPAKGCAWSFVFVFNSIAGNDRFLPPRAQDNNLYVPTSNCLHLFIWPAAVTKQDISTDGQDNGQMTVAYRDKI